MKYEYTDASSVRIVFSMTSYDVRRLINNIDELLKKADRDDRFRLEKMKDALIKAHQSATDSLSCEAQHMARMMENTNV